MEIGKLVISFILSIILCRFCRHLRMKITGADVMFVNSGKSMAIIMVVAFFIYTALSGR